MSRFVPGLALGFITGAVAAVVGFAAAIGIAATHDDHQTYHSGADHVGGNW